MGSYHFSVLSSIHGLSSKETSTQNLVLEIPFNVFKLDLIASDRISTFERYTPQNSDVLIVKSTA